MKEQTIHVWGYDNDEHGDVRATIYDGPVAMTAPLVRATITDRGHQVLNTRRARRMDGHLVSERFVVNADGATMWHALTEAGDPWL